MLQGNSKDFVIGAGSALRTNRMNPTLTLAITLVAVGVLTLLVAMVIAAATHTSHDHGKTTGHRSPTYDRRSVTDEK
jgi:hypothetical protein